MKFADDMDNVFYYGPRDHDDNSRKYVLGSSVQF